MRFRMISAALGLAAAVGYAAPALANHDTPLKANKFLATFVRAYNQCGGGPLTHNAPLAFSACTPVPASNALQWGPKGLGQVKGVVLVNSSKLATDVKLVSSFVEVRDGANVPFNGTITVTSAIRTTDHHCTTPGECTLIDVPFPVNVGCGSSAVVPTSGGKCKLTTSANAVLPGAVVPGKNAGVELGQLQVYSGVDLGFTEGILLP